MVNEEEYEILLGQVCWILQRLGGAFNREALCFHLRILCNSISWEWNRWFLHESYIWKLDQKSLILHKCWSYINVIAYLYYQFLNSLFERITTISIIVCSYNSWLLEALFVISKQNIFYTSRKVIFHTFEILDHKEESSDIF